MAMQIILQSPKTNSLMAIFLFSSEWFRVIIFLLLSTFSLVLFKRWKKGMGSAKLPPGPPRLPIIGNLHQIGKYPHDRSLWKLSKKYGPVMLLQLGSTPTLVVSSADMAKEVLRTHDVDCCSRPPSPGTRKLTYNFLDVAFSPYSDNWREMRRIFVSELICSKREQSFQNAREEEVNRLISYISQASPNPVDMDEKIFGMGDGIVGKVALGKSYGGKQFTKEELRHALDEATQMLNSFTAEDFFPSIVGRTVYALSGLRARDEKCFRDLDGYFEMVLDEHLDPARPKPDSEDLVDVLIRLSKEQTDLRITRGHIKTLIMDVFLGGIDTSAFTMVWLMTELVNNPRVLNKLQAEIRSVVGRKPKVDREDIPNLKYLKMVVKETLRMNPPAPLLIPHQTIRHCKIGSEGYDVFPETRILVNAWAIARDPKIWKNPHEFYPERFQDIDIDYRGKNFELVPFGAGRRICPGVNMATQTVEYTMANLLFCFDWKLPSGMKREHINVEEAGDINIHKRGPLCLVPIKYNWQV